jgi:predicted esterase
MLCTGTAYLPVILLHGIFSDAVNMDGLKTMITSAHPGTRVYDIDGFDNLDSMKEMWTQVDWFKKKMLPIFQNSTDGVHLIGFSQGTV